jgi:putative glutamine amidotransferase
MKSKRPNIAVAACIMHEDPLRPLFKGKALHYTEQKMARALWRVGGMPLAHVDIPEDSGASIEEHLDRCRGLLLQGGTDCAPESYGETPLRPEWAGDPRRDAYEIRLIEAAMARQMPILGICRGAQILNVALGGTLYQDLVTQLEGSEVHRDWDPYDELSHDVALTDPSWIASVYGRKTIIANSVHHQGVKDAAPGFKITARAPDGVIEAIEKIEGDTWLAGVQWHPEWLDPEVASATSRSQGDEIFRAFIEICADWKP